MRHLTRFITSLTLGLAFTLGLTQAQAQTVSAPQRIDLGNGNSVFFTTLAVIQGQPGEPQELTINRAAQALEAFTQTTQMEACGAITVNTGDVMRITIGTIHSHGGCVLVPDGSGGFTSNGMSIHSHPDRRTFIANAADVAANSAAESLIPQIHVGQRVPTSRGYLSFSATDLLASMSYLVAGGHLLYQAHGRIQDRGEIASLPTAAPVAIAIAP